MSYQPEAYIKLTHPEWSQSASIYQINTRQFTEAGTFAAAQEHLPRLKQLGVGILWLMPIHEIGLKHRKGSLGSPYAVRDYRSVNPEFGTLADLKRFVEAAHALGIKVILDWVANHTAWDHVWVEAHPEWYERDQRGQFRPTPWWDWDDIINLDYSQPALREAMIEAMKYWLEEADIDGYRCDVAGFVPVDFWNEARKQLDALKPVFMLAEWESRDLHAEAFDMTYAWSWYDAVLKLCQGQTSVVESLFVYYSWNESAFPKGSLRMTFVSNHDKNAWDGTMFEQFGAGLEAAIVLSVIGEGVPLIYNGQEAGNDRRLPFFEKDSIDWRDHPIGALYQSLIGLKKSHQALWNGEWGGPMVRVPNDCERQVLSFVRAKGPDKVLALFNFSDSPQSVTFRDFYDHGSYKDWLTGQPELFGVRWQLDLEPWAYRVFTQSSGGGA